MPSSATPFLCAELRASRACRTAGSLEQAWKTRVVQKPEEKVAEIFAEVRHLNQSK